MDGDKCSVFQKFFKHKSFFLLKTLKSENLWSKQVQMKLFLPGQPINVLLKIWNCKNFNNLLWSSTQDYYPHIIKAE